MYSIMHQGKRLTKSLKTRDEKEAQKNYLKVRNEFGGRIDRGDLEPTGVKNYTIENLLSDYLKDIRANGRKSANITASVLGKIQAAKEFTPTRKVASLTTADFKSYRERETAAGVAPATINNRFALIHAAMNLESKQTPSKIGKIPHIPMMEINNTRKGFLEYEDHTSVLDALPQSLKAMFIIAFHSGCRKGEVLNMRWSDVDWKNKVIRLPETKNGDQRNLPFWGGIEAQLKAQKKHRDAHHPECEHLFFWMADDVQIDHGGRRNIPGTPVINFRASWTTAIEEAHRLNKNVLAGLLFHDLRRSGVRVMIQEAGIPESQAMLISGHKTREMLERYNIVSLRNVQDAGSKLHAWSLKQAKPKSKGKARGKPSPKAKPESA